MIKNKNINPFIHTYSSTRVVMYDVIIALLPLVFVAWLAYGINALKLIGVSIITAIIVEWIFSFILLKKKNSILDGSAIVTALLLVFTLSPATPWYVVSFGTFSAILFGKILWGGIGKNLFNPALVGREFMAVFFASIMASPDIWKTSSMLTTPAFNINSSSFIDNYLIQLIYKTSGALGEYSIICLIIGGIYLIMRNRISWHIPFAILTSFVVLLYIFGSENLDYSLAGILLGTIFMATDLPSSPTTKHGKLYYGIMIGVAIYCFIKGGCRYEYMSFAILLLNAFSSQISNIFKPHIWGRKIDWYDTIESIFLITVKILIAILGILSLHYYNLIEYGVYAYIIYIILRFNFSESKKINTPI